MTDTAIQTHTEKHVIVMKNGATHLVSSETAARVSEHLVNQEAHSFIKISELGATINSAEISAVYTPDQYQHLVKIQGGEYLCGFGTWHPKRAKCDCAAEKAKEREQELARLHRLSENRPLTEEEKKEQQRIIKRNREILEQKGVLAKGKRVGYTLKRSMLEKYKKDHGREYEIPPNTEIIEDVTPTP